MNYEELKKQVYETACAHGWHETDLGNETYLMLVITEVAEAVNADRRGSHADIDAFRKYEAQGVDFKENYQRQIKGTVEEELADIVIRLLDFAASRGVPIRCCYHSTYQYPTFAEMAFGVVSSLVFPQPLEYTVAQPLWTITAYCKAQAIDLEWHVAQKMKYNQLRSYKHGGKAY